VLFFKAGQIYEIGELALQDNQTLYIEGGAVVKGCLRTIGAQNVTVRGRGVSTAATTSVDANRAARCFSSTVRVFVSKTSS
jgi:hypothetical protein